ncbi:hypothetical protein FQA39_LY07469 [Lamprigera yunnana]|nr:hypothetical protein FQA39_LY07469 [Lamprigera yunnana]
MINSIINTHPNKIISSSSQDVRRNAICKEALDLHDLNRAEALIVIPPDGGWGWFVVAAGFCVNFVVDGIIYTFGLFLEDIAKSLNSTTTKVAFTNSLMTGCYFLSGPLVSVLINSCGYRKVTILGGVLAAFSLFATSYCTNLTSLFFVCGVCCGISFGMIYLASIIAVSFYFEKWRGLAQSITCCGSSIGICIFPSVFTILFKNLTWRFKFRILSGCAILCSVYGFFFRTLKPVKVRETRRLPSIKESNDNELKKTKVDEKLPRYNNLEYPTASELYKVSTVIVQPPEEISYTSITDSASVTESVVTVSSFSKLPSKTKLSVERLQTVYETSEEKDHSLGDRCRNIHSWLCYICSGKRQNTTMAIALYRDDIFYQGSLLKLPEYVKSTSIDKITVGYHLSLRKAETRADREKEFHTCICITETTKRSLVMMLDVSVLKSISFLLISMSGLFLALGSYTPFMFIVNRAVDSGISKSVANHLITTIGIANTVGRIISGLSSSLFSIDVLNFSSAALIINGVTVLISSIFFTEMWQFGCAFLYGLTMGCVVALRPMIIVESVGLQKMTNAFGICVVFQGIACLIGLPLSGYLKTVAGSYNASFYFAGGVTLISAILLILAKRMRLWERRK